MQLNAIFTAFDSFFLILFSASDNTHNETRTKKNDVLNSLKRIANSFELCLKCVLMR